MIFDGQISFFFVLSSSFEVSFVNQLIPIYVRFSRSALMPAMTMSMRWRDGALAMAMAAAATAASIIRLTTPGFVGSKSH